LGNALGRRAWIARRPAGWRIYVQYRGEPLEDESVEAVERACGTAKPWGTRCSTNQGTIKLTVWIELQAADEQD
jgi:hypothetical protein